jgi:hypothetical protein
MAIPVRARCWSAPSDVLEAAAECTVPCTDELTGAVVARLAERVQARPTPEHSDPRLLLDQHRQRIEAWLQQDKPPKLVRIHELLTTRWCRRLVHHAARIRTRRVRLARSHADGARRCSSARRGGPSGLRLDGLCSWRRGLTSEALGFDRHADDEPASVRVAHFKPGSFVRERWFAGESFTDDVVVLRASAAA